jgi:hypothetical protein
MKIVEVLWIGRSDEVALDEAKTDRRNIGSFRESVGPNPTKGR